MTELKSFARVFRDCKIVSDENASIEKKGFKRIKYSEIIIQIRNKSFIKELFLFFITN